jgi:predicted CXXCH cytochrome family protein
MKHCRAKAPGPAWIGYVVLLLVVLLATTGEAYGARQFSSQRECATCHIMWLNDFKRKDVTTLIPYDPKPTVDTGKQDIASTERMCFSCHDGFALDSRSNWRNKQHNHPVGVKPSARIKIPTSEGKTVFPLNDDGKVYCGTCHTAHGVSWTQQEAPVFMRVNNVDSRLCLACHLNQATGPKEGNHPLFKKPPHDTQQLKKAGAKFARDGTVICQTCHQPHGAPSRKMLVMDNSGSGLCQHCHQDKREVSGSKHDMSLMAPEAVNRNGNTAAESGPCGACHVPHNGKGPALWARERAQGVEPAAASCLGCHNDKGPAHKKTLGGHSHPVGKSINELGIKVVNGKWKTNSPLARHDKSLKSLPLYDAHGLRSDRGKNVGCGSCHDPHKWQPVGTAPKADPKILEGDDQSSFLRIAGDTDSSLCTTCHIDKRSVLLSKHNPNIEPEKPGKARQEKSRKKKRAPSDAAHDAGKSVCQSCHVPHNAKAANLWAREPVKAESAIAGLCGDCHRKGGVAENKLTGVHSHPLGKPLKKASRNKLPVFDEAGHRVKQGGSVDCASCHNPHQWDPADPLSDKGASAQTEGDTTTSFLRQVVAKESLLCLSCHDAQRWVHNTEHDLRITGKNSKNVLGQSVQESGPCGQCHVPHNAADQTRIWARTMGQGEDKLEQMCRSCHSDVGIASAKQPPSATHPDQVSVWSGETRKRFRKPSGQSLPVFDQHGKPGPTGKITCVTCHDPHRWSSTAKSGPGKNIEGSTANSFLRIQNSENFVCADCHGLDAIFRYKYFHGKASRRKHRLYQ